MHSTHHAPPQPPDMLSDGTPHVTHLRTSQARQVNTNPVTEPQVVYRREGLIHRLPRGIRSHWSALVFGVLLMVGLYLGVEKLVLPTWNNLQNQWHYGDNRIVQLDANVGHGGMSHFLAQWYHHEIVIVEIPENNPHSMHVYKLEPLSTDQEGTITLTVEDVNHNGRLDLVIQVDGEPWALILYNTGTGFSGSEG